MAAPFPVTHSIPSAKALLAVVESDYDVGRPVACQLLGSWLNDTYLVRTEEERYVLRVYRAGWRSMEAIGYELDVLGHLGRRGVPVSLPVLRRDGGLTRVLEAPEGVRPVVLFTYASGKRPLLDDGECTRYGRAAAEIHNATEEFESPHARFGLDLVHLIEGPLERIRPLLEHRPEDWEYLLKLAARLREGVEQASRDGLSAGFCHGDFHGGNVHQAEDETMTFFDFDCCGPGWRAYDVAVFRWGAKLEEKEEARWPAFLKGYTERRTLSDVDREAVPLFVAIRHFWFLGLLAGNQEHYGLWWMDDAYFDQALKFLREWESAHKE